jgi:hypothetical protein
MKAAFLGLTLLVSPALAFQVTLDSGAGSLTIVDNDVNDLNPGLGEIEFNQTVGGIFQAEARVTQSFPPANRQINLESRTDSGEAVFRNLDAAPHTFVVTVDTDTFTAPGAPLGWSIASSGVADDTTTPTQADLEIPTNDVALSINSGGVALGTLSLPITPAVVPADQPVVFDEILRGSNGSDATQMRLVWSFSPGANDEIRLPGESLDPNGEIVVTVFNAEDRCVIKMNKRAARLAKLAGVDDAKCVKNATSAGGDATACVDDPNTPKTVSGEEKLLADFGTFCAIPPAFATNTGTCCDGGANDGDSCTAAPDCPGGTCTAGACISGAAADAANAVTHDLFGATVSVGTQATGSCQHKVLKAAVNLHEIRWKSLAKCKQKNIATLPTEADFVTTCLGPPQPAFTNIAAKETALAKRIEKLCLNKGITPLSSVFPGACAGEADVDYATCLGQRIACRFCLGAVLADDIAAPLDCDAFDDGTANASCP